MTSTPTGTTSRAGTSRWSDPAGDLAGFEHIAHGRRSSMLIDAERSVPKELLERLCRLIYSAPNHKRTKPWQVAVFGGDQRATLGAALAADQLAAKPDIDQARLDKTRAKYRRAPAVVLVGIRVDEESNEVRRREDLAAVAAGVQNFLLGAWSAGLQCLWSSPPAVRAPQACALAGFGDDVELLAIVYTGWPAAEAPEPARATPDVAFHGHDA